MMKDETNPSLIHPVQQYINDNYLVFRIIMMLFVLFKRLICVYE